jgi:hypothetical protein
MLRYKSVTAISATARKLVSLGLREDNLRLEVYDE